jgi:hypothetical protein
MAVLISLNIELTPTQSIIFSSFTILRCTMEAGGLWMYFGMYDAFGMEVLSNLTQEHDKAYRYSH